MNPDELPVADEIIVGQLLYAATSQDGQLLGTLWMSPDGKSRLPFLFPVSQIASLREALSALETATAQAIAANPGAMTNH